MVKEEKEKKEDKEVKKGANDKKNEKQTEQKQAERFTYGLSEKEAEKRLEEYGQNRLVIKGQTASDPLYILNIFLDHFQLPVIILLLAVMIILLFTTDSILGLIALGFILVMIIGEMLRDLEVRDSIKEIQGRYISHIIVIRDGTKKTIPSSELVPGDIVLLFPGMRVPADGMILKGTCRVDESAFDRGVVERKRKEKLEERELPKFGEKEEEEEKKEGEYYRLLAGSFIVEGEILMVVEKTGRETKIASSIQREPKKKYMVVEKIDEITSRLSNIMLGIALVIFIILLFNKTPFLTAFLIAAAAAVAGTPESILLTTRVAFLSSLKRIEGLAIRSEDLPERLGKITVICTERFKALSRGEPTVHRLWIDKANVEVTGEGWSRAGKFKGIEDYETIDLLAESLIISTSAAPIYRDTGAFYFEDEHEGALVTLAMKNNMSTETIRHENYCIERKTDPETEVVTSVHTNSKRQTISYIRGPARKVAEMCDFVFSKGKREKISRTLKEEVEYKIIEMAADGLAPYAIAFGFTSKGKTKYALIGIMGLYDPPKPEIRQIVDEAKAAGIKIVILTEEKASSAVDFARQLGILTSNTRAIICDQLRFLRDAEKIDTIRKTVVFAMATSEDKKMIIEELKKMKETVLFVDSGNADVSALKSADASISLESAAELSKYNADAILLNDNFYWVPKSVEESKALGDVVIRSFYSLFISDFAIIFLILLSAILTAKPMNILQILFVNLIADSLIGIGLAMDRRHGSALKSSLQFPSKNAFAFAIFMAVYAAVAVFVVANYVPSAYFTSVATAGIVLCAVANALNFSTDSSIFKSRPSNRILLAVTAAIVFLLFITYVPTVNTVFGMLPLQPMHWGLVLMAAVSSILIMEIRKAVAK